ncbi:hypothetical protein [Streptomyces sp. NRRL B-24484]|uniref:hypothetical protein n=1 Tax=Streptomyces sp. NRRL B-24484 TaxID=1463833 RepID=UPI0004C293F7|nr:hypothetical protein [Streptomyces sp. NRRL B-24484]
MSIDPHPTPEAKLARFTEHTSGGHARWTGPRNGPAPRLRHSGRQWRILDLAFRVRWGREPVGPVRPGCGVPWCLAGEHLEDARDRKAFRAIGL